MNLGGVTVGSGDVSSALALLTVLANPEQHKKALEELGKQVKIAEDAFAGAQKTGVAAEAALKEAGAIRIAAEKKEAAAAERQAKMDEEQRKFAEAQASFNDMKNLHGVWHTAQTKIFEDEKKLQEKNRKELEELKKNAEADLAEAKKIKSEGEELKRQHGEALAKLKMIVAQTEKV